MNLELKGKTAFVAGASNGIGKAIAKELAKEGCDLMLCARSEEALRSLAMHIRNSYQTKCSFTTIDLSAPRDIERGLRETFEQYNSIDILITNSGGPPAGIFESINEKQWEHAFQNTLMHVVRLARGFIPGMKKHTWGRIINITSVSAKQPIERLLLSNVFRPAVTGLAKTLSVELASFHITVNNVAPGYTLTSRMEELFTDRAAKENVPIDEVRDGVINKTALHRLASPEEIAHAVVFLASERASYITGVTLQVDGGYIKSLF